MIEASRRTKASRCPVPVGTLACPSDCRPLRLASGQPSPRLRATPSPAGRNRLKRRESSSLTCPRSQGVASASTGVLSTGKGEKWPRSQLRGWRSDGWRVPTPRSICQRAGARCGFGQDGGGRRRCWQCCLADVGCESCGAAGDGVEVRGQVGERVGGVGAAWGVCEVSVERNGVPAELLADAFDGVGEGAQLSGEPAAGELLVAVVVMRALVAGGQGAFGDLTFAVGVQVGLVVAGQFPQPACLCPAMKRTMAPGWRPEPGWPCSRNIGGQERFRQLSIALPAQCICARSK